MATNAGLQVLSWFENLPRDEQPPRHIWWSGDLLDEWFEDVEERRNAKYGQSGRKRTSWDEGTEVPLVENELAQQYREAARG